MKLALFSFDVEFCINELLIKLPDLPSMSLFVRREKSEYHHRHLY